MRRRRPKSWSLTKIPNRSGSIYSYSSQIITTMTPLQTSGPSSSSLTALTNCKAVFVLSFPPPPPVPLPDVQTRLTSPPQRRARQEQSPLLRRLRLQYKRLRPLQPLNSLPPRGTIIYTDAQSSASVTLYISNSLTPKAICCAATAASDGSLGCDCDHWDLDNQIHLMPNLCKGATYTAALVLDFDDKQ